MGEGTFDERVEAVRHFNRFYTRHIRILNERYLRSLFSVAEARVIYELARRGSATATELGTELGLDPGYASRILRRLRRQGLMGGEPLEGDGRQTVLRLSEKGRRTFLKLDQRSRDDIASLLVVLPEPEQRKVVRGMAAIERLLSSPPVSGGPFTVRPHRTGDLGWVLERHAILFRQDCGWDERFESQVAGMVADFIPNTEPGRERCWMAETDGENVGCAFVVERNEGTAELRMLMVEPGSRRQGVGTRLVEQCIGFARDAGYRKLMLQVEGVLTDARRLFEKAGFRMTGKERQQRFGRRLVLESWELPL